MHVCVHLSLNVYERRLQEIIYKHRHKMLISVSEFVYIARQYVRVQNEVRRLFHMTHKIASNTTHMIVIKLT